MKKARALYAALALGLSCFWVAPTAQAAEPNGTDKTLQIALGSSYDFQAGDWGFSDPGDSPPDNFTRVTLTTLPGNGSLTVNGVAATAGLRTSPFPGQAGATWTARDTLRSWQAITSSSDGSKLAAAVYGGQIYTSTDFGVSWTARESNRQWYSITSSSDGSKLAAVVNGGSIYTSTDSGLSWTARESSRNWQSITSSSDGVKLAAMVYGGKIYTSTNSGVSWTARESDRQWKSITSSSDGSKLAAVVSNGQIYTSTDSGVSWTARESTRQWQSITSSADGSKLAAVVFNGQIYTSADSGLNWVARESSRQWFSITSSIDGSRLAATVLGGQIYTSADSGVTWTARESNRQWYSVASSSDGSKLAAVADSGQIYTSLGSGLIRYTAPATAGGTSFTFQVEDSGPNKTRLDPTPNSITIIVAPTVTRNTANLASSANTLTISGAGFSTTPANNTVALNLSGTTATVTAATSTQLTVSLSGIMPPGPLRAIVTTNGASSAEVQVATVISSAPSGTDKTITLAPGETYVFLASDWGFSDSQDNPANLFSYVNLTTLPNYGYITVDGVLASFSDNVSPYPRWLFWVARETNREWRSITSSSDGSKLAAVEYGGQIYTSTDSGLSWSARESNRNWQSITASSDGGKLAAVVDGGQIYISADSGVSWTARDGNRQWRAIASSSDGGKLAAVVAGGRIYTSTDSGVSWTAREGNRQWQSVASSSDGGKLAAVVAGGQIYTSTDSGVTWTARESNRQWESIASSSDGGKLTAVVAGGQIFTSSDSGVSWTARDTSRQWQSIASSSDGRILAAMALGGIYVSTDSGATWTEQANWIYGTLGSITASSDGSKLAAAAAGGQIYTSEANGVIRYTAPSEVGSVGFDFQVVDNGMDNDQDPTPNTITINIAPRVSLNTTNLDITATTLTINGAGFSTMPGANLIEFSPTGTGEVTSSTETTLTVTNLSGLTPGPLSAVVTIYGVSSGSPVQVGTVTDALPPVISLNGSPSVIVNWGSVYTDAGATATDNVDSSVTVTTSGTVNAARPGVYTITYNATDAAGNVATAVTRSVTVAIANPDTVGADGYAPLMKYAFGANAPTDNIQAPAFSSTPTTLALTAVVRTNAPEVVVSGEATTDLRGVWGTVPVTEALALDQTNLPANCERRVYTVNTASLDRVFIRLKVVATP